MKNQDLKESISDAALIILDIEGTISSIDFVRKELLTYSDEHLENFILKNWDEAKEAVVHICNESLKFRPENPLPIIPSGDGLLNSYKKDVISYLKWQISNYDVSPGLKMMQGLILANAFKTGKLISHIYPDVTSALKVWFGTKKIYTYSTGSVTAQEEFLKHTVEGCIRQFIDNLFDTTIGSKLIAESYGVICEFANVRPSEAVFFSDRPKEIVAAKKCGLTAVLVNRDSSTSLMDEESEFLGVEDGVITSFMDIISENPN